MAVEASKSGTRQVVEVTWDTDIISGDAVRLHCVNPDNGDVSVSGVSQNTGKGHVSYPQGYTGRSEITVQDGAGNTDTGTIAVDGENAETVPPDETTPTPPDLGIWPDPPEGSVLPEHPIVIPPGLDDDFWTGNLPPSEHPPHPEPN